MNMTSMLCKIGTSIIASLDINNPSTNIGITEVRANGHVNYTCSIEIPPNMSVDLYVVMKARHKEPVQDAYFIAYPIINATLIVNFPDNYEFHLFPSFSNDLKQIISDNNRHVYEMNGGALPNQGFYYELKRKVLLANNKGEAL